jgi:hypothetical protein
LVTGKSSKLRGAELVNGVQQVPKVLLGIVDCRGRMVRKGRRVPKGKSGSVVCRVRRAQQVPKESLVNVVT